MGAQKLRQTAAAVHRGTPEASGADRALASDGHDSALEPVKPQRVVHRSSLQDVAKLAGVSAAAVSYVVNGRTGEVGAKTRSKIESAIKSLRYQPQRRGLSLKLNREFAIGLVIVDPSPNFLSDPFTTQVATGLSNALIEPGYGLTVRGCSSMDDFSRFLRRPIGVDAFVIITSGPKSTRDAAYKLLSELHLPVIVVQDKMSDHLDDACAIYQDDFGGAQMLARHVLARGAKRILFVAPSRDWPAIERREQGIVSVLPDTCTFAKVKCDERDFAATARAIDQALDGAPLPDVIMGANDQIAIAALRVLDRRDIRIPDSIQVTGYNDFTFRNYVNPLLTTVKSNADEIGYTSAAALLSRLDKGTFERTTIQLPVNLDIGETTRR